MLAKHRMGRLGFAILMILFRATKPRPIRNASLYSASNLKPQKTD